MFSAAISAETQKCLLISSMPTNSSSVSVSCRVTSNQHRSQNYCINKTDNKQQQSSTNAEKHPKALSCTPLYRKAIGVTAAAAAASVLCTCYTCCCSVPCCPAVLLLLLLWCITLIVSYDMSTIYRRTQVDGSYDYPAVRNSSDSYTILRIQTSKRQPTPMRAHRATRTICKRSQ